MRTREGIYRIFALSMTIAFMAAITPGQSMGKSAKTSIGMVKELRSGTLEREENGAWKPLALGAGISAGDRVRTGRSSTAVLSLTNLGAMLIGPDTEYTLGTDQRNFRTTLKRGYLWISARLSSGRSMSVATSTAVAGIRGTKFSVIQDEDGMEVCTCKGMVRMSLKNGDTMDISSGRYASIDAAGKVEKPQQGKPHLAKLWKEKTERYAPCLTCHKQGLKISDLN